MWPDFTGKECEDSELVSHLMNCKEGKVAISPFVCLSGNSDGDLLQPNTPNHVSGNGVYTLKKNWMHASMLFRKSSNFPNWKKKSRCMNRNIQKMVLLRPIWFQFFSVDMRDPPPLYSIPKYHHFSSVFVVWRKFVVKRAHITILRPSWFCYKCYKSHMYSGSLMSKMVYKELDTLGICWIIHWMLE